MLFPQQVQEAEGKKLAEDFGAVFFETSAKSSTSIEELFITLGELGENRAPVSVPASQHCTELVWRWYSRVQYLLGAWSERFVSYLSISSTAALICLPAQRWSCRRASAA
jgi:hypothetical protein